MKNKYYIPSPEELFEGYECEQFFLKEHSGNITVALHDGATEQEWKEAWDACYASSACDYEFDPVVITAADLAEINDQEPEFSTQHCGFIGKVLPIYRTPYLTGAQLEAEGYTATVKNGYAKGHIDVFFYEPKHAVGLWKLDTVSGLREFVWGGECKSINELRKAIKSIS